MAKPVESFKNFANGITRNKAVVFAGGFGLALLLGEYAPEAHFTVATPADGRFVLAGSFGNKAKVERVLNRVVGAQETSTYGLFRFEPMTDAGSVAVGARLVIVHNPEHKELTSVGVSIQ